MRICYQCAWCGEEIAALEVAQVDEAKFGFDCLTSEEREDIINIDAPANTMHVKSLCDRCVETTVYGAQIMDFSAKPDEWLH